MTGDGFDIIRPLIRGGPPKPREDQPTLSIDTARRIVEMGAGPTACDPQVGLLLSEMEDRRREDVFEHVLRAAGGRSEARGADVLVHHASGFHVVAGGEVLLGQLVGVPILYSEESVDERNVTGDDIGAVPCSVAADAFSTMGGYSPHPGMARAHILPILPDHGFLGPGTVGEMLAGAKAWIQHALAPPVGQDGKLRFRFSKNVKTGWGRILRPSRTPRAFWFLGEHGHGDGDRIVIALALGVVLGEEPLELPVQRGGSLTPSGSHPGVWFGTAQPFALAASDLMALGVLAKLRRRCGAEPFAGSETETLHICDRESGHYPGREVDYALEIEGGGVGTASVGAIRLCWHGPAYVEALRRSVPRQVVHVDATTMPSARKAGSPDPRKIPAEEIAADAAGRQLGFGDIANAFDRLFREPGSTRPDQIGNRKLGEFTGVPIMWSRFSNKPPVPSTIGEVVRQTSSQVSRQILQAVGDRHADRERREEVEAAWVRRIRDVPLIQLLVDEKFDATLLKDEVATPEEDEDPSSKTGHLDAGDGLRARFRLTDGQPGSEDLAFRNIRADLVSGSDETLSSLRIVVVRKRRRSTRLTARHFLQDMDSQSDDLASLGVRLMEIVKGPGKLFARGDLVVLFWHATRDDVRRRGHASRLLGTVLAEIKRRYPGTGTLIVPLAAPSMRITPGRNAPADLLMRYQSLFAVSTSETD